MAMKGTSLHLTKNGNFQEICSNWDLCLERVPLERFDYDDDDDWDDGDDD